MAIDHSLNILYDILSTKLLHHDRFIPDDNCNLHFNISSKFWKPFFWHKHQMDTEK